MATFGAQCRLGLIDMGAEEENSMLMMLIDIFEKRSMKYNKKAVRTLLGWCKVNDVLVMLKNVSSIQTWQSAGKLLFEAASRGDKIAITLLTTWRLVLDLLKQLKVDRETNSVFAMPMDIFEKRSVRYGKTTIRLLLVWCEKYDLPLIVKKVFSVQTWQSIGKVLLEAASRGDKTATAPLITWRLIIDCLEQSEADRDKAYINNANRHI